MSVSSYKITKAALLACGLAILVYSCLVFYHVTNHPYKGFYVFKDCKVVEVAPDSVAARQGLQPGDRVIEIDGKPVRSLVDYLALSDKLTIGEKAEIVVERGDEKLSMEILVTRHPFPYSALVWLTVGMAGLVAGFLVYAGRPEENGAALFCLITTCAIGAFVGGVNWYVLIDNVVLLSTFIITGTMVTPLAMHFCLVFPKRKNITRKYKWLIPALYVPHIAVLIAIETLNIRAYGKHIDGESLRHVFSVMATLVNWYFALVGLYLLAGLTSVIHSYRASTSSEAEKRLKWLFWASGAAAVPASFAAYVAIVDFDRFAFGGATLWILMASVLLLMGHAFAVMKYRLKDIDTLISRSIAYFFVSGVSVAGYYCLVVVGGLLLTALAGESSLAARALAILVIAIVFRPVSEMVQRFVDKKFFPSRYKYQKTILKVSSDITAILELDKLLDKIVGAVSESLEAEKAAIFLKNGHTGDFEVRAARGMGSGAAAIKSDSALARKLAEEESALLCESTDSQAAPHETALAELGFKLALPLFFEGDMIGIFALGDKSSKDIYSSEEISLLRALANEAALAIRNATSYTLIEKLNQELAAKVKRIENQHSQIVALQKQLVDENRYLKEEIGERYDFREIAGSSEGLKSVLSMVEKVAVTQSVVLIRGESGTGKELIARAIHFNSNRRDKPFVKVNCAALSEGVLESELFGHERGSFTGAIKQKTGKFELAHGGTIFLDEIGDISPKTQLRLLRVLQEREFERVGGNETIKVDVRVIASTNRDLEKAVRDGQFREDLFYRLNVISIFVPPLRERKDDICELALHFLNRFNAEIGKNVRSIDDEAMQLMMDYHWPGNIRELQNMIERAVVLCEGNSITVEDLPFGHMKSIRPGRRESAPTADGTLPGMLDNLERDRLSAALREFNGNKAAAARSLGLKRTTFISKLRKYGLA